MLANGFLVLVLTGILYYQYFFESPDGEMASIASIAQQRTPAATTSHVSAASKTATMAATITKNAVEKKSAAESDWKYTLSCKDSEKTLTQSRTSLILNLQKCESEFPKQIVIENQTNGFTASVFAVSDSYSKTDSIPLKKGKNVIVIKYQTSKMKTNIVEKLSVSY